MLRPVPWHLVIRASLSERMHKKTFIIAEAGVNHNGSLRIAKRLIDAAVNSGADAVKFQTFNARELVSRYAPKAGYQKTTTGKSGNQLEMIKKLELNLGAYKKLLNYCSERIIFLSSPFDLKSIDLLAGLGLKIFKIPSGEITNLPYLRKIGSLRKQIILSTGMANLKEINDALDVLRQSGTKKDSITVLHCNTEYPTPFEDVNLLAMLTIKNRLGVNVGYSDHTLGIQIAIGAVALGAMVIEKHITLNKKMIGPDHKASLEPAEFKLMSNAIRNVETALGSSEKIASRSERKNIPVVRKSIVAARVISKGEVLTSENITVKRPGTGISPMKWDEIIGLRAKSNFNPDQLISIKGT